MNTDERIQWCIAQAEEIEARMAPIEDPHEWDGPRMAAAFWRELARRLAA